MPEAGPNNERRPALKAPLLALAASFALGIVWAHSFRTTVGVYGFAAGSATCILIGLVLLRAGWERMPVVLVLASMVLTGAAASRRWEKRFPPTHVCYLESWGANLESPVRLRGRVISTPFHVAYGSQYDLEAEEVELQGHFCAVTGKVRLRVQGRDGRVNAGGKREVRFGDEILASVRLRRPHAYQNPGSFDFRRWMEDIEDIYWVGTVRNPRFIEKIGHPEGHRFAEMVESARQRLLRGIDDIYPPWSGQGRYGAVLKAVLWGDRSALDAGTIEDFRRTGLYHLLVIAGLHVGLLTLLVEFLLRWLGCRRVARAFLVLGFLGVYALLVEQRAPTLRATLMIALYLVARILDRNHSPLNAIGGVALGLLYFRPAWLYESGFQLSFSAALLIVGVGVPVLARTTEPYRRALLRLDDVLLDDRFSPRIAQLRLDLRAVVQALRRRAHVMERFPALSRNVIVTPLKLLVWVANMLVFSAVLQLGLMLPMVEIFHRVTFAGVGLNALAIPVMTLLLALALPINLLSVASPALATWPAKVLSMVMALLFEMTHFPGMAAWLSYRMPTPPHWVAWGFCLTFVLAALALRFARQLASVALAACAVFVALVAVQPFAPRLPQGVLQITGLDCGAGDALFVVFPDGTTMLVDAGDSNSRSTRQVVSQRGKWNSGEDIVSPYLWSLGVKKIDVVVMTRAPGDELESFNSVVENFRVGEVWRDFRVPYPQFSQDDPIHPRSGPLVRTLAAGDTLLMSGASIHVLWPTRRSPDAAPSLDPDDDPLVMRVTVGSASFLVADGSGEFVENGGLPPHERLASQVLRMSYRGATAVPQAVFLEAIAPQVVLLNSASRRDGPKSASNANEMEALESRGIRAFRPDLDGAVTVQWRSGALVIKTFKGSEAEIMTADQTGPKASVRAPAENAGDENRPPGAY